MFNISLITIRANGLTVLRATPETLLDIQAITFKPTELTIKSLATITVDIKSKKFNWFQRFLIKLFFKKDNWSNST